MAEPFDITSARRFLGTGWAFPMAIDGRGGIATVAEDELLTRAIRIILLTVPGERHMRPEFGCRIHNYVFAPNNDETRSFIGYEVREALGRWEPRIEVDTVDVEPDPADDSHLLIHIGYRVKANNDERNLVHPFYLIPGED